MADFVRYMQACEGRNRILSVSFVHSFGLADVPEGGAKVMVIADRDAEVAQALADNMAKRLWDIRCETARTWQSLDDVLNRVITTDAGPLVVADFCDNPGGGAPETRRIFLRH